MTNVLRNASLASLFVVALVAIGGCTGSEKSAALGAAASFKVYQGAWFQIRYPESFTPRPSLVSTSADGHDSAFFRSPDGSAEFYVCAPQWGRETSDIAIDEATEILVSDESIERGLEIERNWTIAAKDRSYSRSYEEIASADGTTRRVLGFRYADRATHQKYLAVYREFKASLELFAD